VTKPNLFTFAFVAILLPLLTGEVQASDLFSKIELEGHKGAHLVIKSDINVRAAPLSKGKKIGKLRKREIVDVLGHAKGTKWFAVRQNGKDLGFVYGSGLSPLIDASLKTPLLGRVDMSDDDKPICTYEIIYDRRTMEETIVFVSSDYLVRFACQLDANFFDFNAMMFMSEIPYSQDSKPIYQITLDLPDFATGYEEYLSATSFYHEKDHKVVMDAVSLAAFKDGDLKAALPARNPIEALKAATKLHLTSFNKKAWRTLAGQIPNPSDIEPQ